MAVGRISTIQLSSNKAHFSVNRQVSIHCPTHDIFFRGEIIEISPLFVKIEFSPSLQVDLEFNLIDGSDFSGIGTAINDFKLTNTLEFSLIDDPFFYLEIYFKKKYHIYGISPD
jgi:hypothetical protein